MIAEAAHALLRPGVAIPGCDLNAIEQKRDLTIRHQSSQLAHQRNAVVGNARIVPASGIEALLHLEFGVIPSLPVQNGVYDCSIPALNNFRQ